MAITNTSMQETRDKLAEIHRRGMADFSAPVDLVAYHKFKAGWDARDKIENEVSKEIQKSLLRRIDLLEKENKDLRGKNELEKSNI